MPNIAPISELRNYGQILEMTKPGTPVYLTKNGKGAYSIHRIEDDEQFEKAKAMARLLGELNRGFTSGDEEGWVSDSELNEHFSMKRKMRTGE